jgi:prolyl oligopeptidase
MRKLPSLFWDVRPLAVALLAVAIAASLGAQTPDDRRTELGALVRRMADYPKVTPPFGGGERLFYFENAGLENQPALYVQDRRELPPRVFIDPNAFSRDGLLAIVDPAASPDGRSLAYAISTQGSSWRRVRIHDARTGQDFGEELHGIRDSSIAWTRDNRGFFYLRVDSARADSHQRVFYHRVGRQQTDDQLVYENREHPDWTLQIKVSEDGQYLAIALRPRGDARNRLYFIDLDNPKRPHRKAARSARRDSGAWGCRGR